MQEVILIFKNMAENPNRYILSLDDLDQIIESAAGQRLNMVDTKMTAAWSQLEQITFIQNGVKIAVLESNDENYRASDLTLDQVKKHIEEKLNTYKNSILTKNIDFVNQATSTNVDNINIFKNIAGANTTIDTYIQLAIFIDCYIEWLGTTSKDETSDPVTGKHFPLGKENIKIDGDTTDEDFEGKPSFAWVATKYICNLYEDSGFEKFNEKIETDEENHEKRLEALEEQYDADIKQIRDRDVPSDPKQKEQANQQKTNDIYARKKKYEEDLKKESDNCKAIKNENLSELYSSVDRIEYNAKYKDAISKISDMLKSFTFSSNSTDTTAPFFIDNAPEFAKADFTSILKSLFIKSKYGDAQKYIDQLSTLIIPYTIYVNDLSSVPIDYTPTDVGGLYDQSIFNELYQDNISNTKLINKLEQNWANASPETIYNKANNYAANVNWMKTARAIINSYYDLSNTDKAYDIETLKQILELYKYGVAAAVTYIYVSTLLESNDFSLYALYTIAQQYLVKEDAAPLVTDKIEAVSGPDTAESVNDKDIRRIGRRFNSHNIIGIGDYNWGRSYNLTEESSAPSEYSKLILWEMQPKSAIPAKDIIATLGKLADAGVDIASASVLDIANRGKPSENAIEEAKQFGIPVNEAATKQSTKSKVLEAGEKFAKSDAGKSLVKTAFTAYGKERVVNNAISALQGEGNETKAIDVTWVKDIMPGYWVGRYEIPFFNNSFMKTKQKGAWKMGNAFEGADGIAGGIRDAFNTNVLDIPTWDFNNATTEGVNWATAFYLINDNVTNIVKNLNFILTFIAGSYWIQLDAGTYHCPNLYRVECPGRFFELYTALDITVDYIGKTHYLSPDDSKSIFGEVSQPNSSENKNLNFQAFSELSNIGEIWIPDAYQISIDSTSLQPNAFNIQYAYFAGGAKSLRPDGMGDVEKLMNKEIKSNRFAVLGQAAKDKFSNL